MNTIIILIDEAHLSRFFVVEGRDLSQFNELTYTHNIAGESIADLLYDSEGSILIPYTKKFPVERVIPDQTVVITSIAS